MNSYCMKYPMYDVAARVPASFVVGTLWPRPRAGERRQLATRHAGPRVFAAKNQLYSQRVHVGI